MADVIIKTGRKVITMKNGTFIEIKPFTQTHLVKYIGYYDPIAVTEGTDYLAYIYRGKLKKTDIKIPGSIYKVNDHYVWVPHDPERGKMYDIRNAKSMDVEDIAKELNKAELEIREVPMDVTDSIDGEIFAPKIRDSDDILKRIIKTVLQNMKLNIRSLRPKFSNDYDLNNLKSQLVKEGAMSSKYFVRWCEILDISIETIIRNKPGSNRLQDEVTVFLE